MNEFAIEAVVADDSWSRFESEMSTVAGSDLGFWDIWYFGPYATVLFAGERRIEYQGSLLYVAQGLYSFTQQTERRFRWEGESVWQSPDIELDADGDEMQLTVAYPRPQRLRMPSDEFSSATAAFLRQIAADVRARQSEPLHVAEMPWLTPT